MEAGLPAKLDHVIPSENTGLCTTLFTKCGGNLILLLKLFKVIRKTLMRGTLRDSRHLW